VWIVDSIGIAYPIKTGVARSMFLLAMGEISPSAEVKVRHAQPFGYAQDKLLPASR
jgi:hypothetical protein